MLAYKSDCPRSRTFISGNQLEILKEEFVQNRFPTPQRKNELSEETGLDYKVITNWFQNKRKLEYRLNKLRTQHLNFPIVKDENPQF